MTMDFQFIRQLTDILCGVQLHLVPNTRESMEQLVESLIREVLFVFPEQQEVMRRLRGLEPGCVYIFGSSLDLQYALFLHSQTGRFLVIGPCRGGVYGEKDVAASLRRHGLSEPRIQSLLAYYRQQPLLSYERLYPLAMLLAQQISGSAEVLPHQHMDFHWQAEARKLLPEEDIPQELEQIRRVETRYAASAAMTEAVKQGNLSLAYQFIQKMQNIPDDLVRNPNSLRNAQNLCIILNTQLRHALEEDGFPPYRLDQLSGGIARQIETFKTTAAVQSYFSEILAQYCAMAQEHSQQGLSAFGRMAVSYIKNHLSDNLTVREAAKALLMNPDYLSARFHQEVGISFIDYVNQERVKQAAALLKRTDLQIQQIASAVGYNNTSYFARQFVRYMGLTPRAWRKNK